MVFRAYKPLKVLRVSGADMNKCKLLVQLNDIEKTDTRDENMIKNK